MFRATSIILVLSLLVAGCAAMFRGSSTMVPVSSTPSGCVIVINGVELGSTPTSLKLKKTMDHMIEIQKEGYKTATINVQKELNWGWLVLDLFLWGVFGLADLGGGAYDLSPETIYVELEPMHSSLDSESLTMSFSQFAQLDAIGVILGDKDVVEVYRLKSQQ